MDLAAGIAIAGQAIGLVKDLREIDRGLDSAEYKAKMAELYSALADVKMALADARDDLKLRDAEIERLRNSLAKQHDLIEVHGFKMLKFEDGTPRGNPFCPICEQKEGRYIHIENIPGNYNVCPNCKSKFGDVPRYLWDQ